ncbi:MAG: hypothetical protein M0Q53_04640 [Prolixibacteraceae bacterium]|nr:hypothetical protein [Prolixibacteraceae bacterium]
MRYLIFIFFVIVFTGSILSCGTGNKSKQIKEYKYIEGKRAITGDLGKKEEAWIKEGMTCYGIIILADKDGNAKKVKEIEARIVSIQPGKIKMKAMEDLVLAPVEGCTKTGIKKGETWDELEGDLFQTREEAINYIGTKYPETQVIVR